MAAPVADGPPGGIPCHPTVVQNTGASILKDEDVLLVEHQRAWPGCDDGAGEGASAGSARCSCCGADTAEYSIFAVFDGHNGVAAARLAAERLVGVLEERLPQGVPPPASAPTWTPWREDIQLALVETLAELNRLFALKGILAGCTATLVLQVGWLLTCANLGDSRAILDTGLESIQMTVDHRVATHKGERRRVEAMGNTVAPIDLSGSGPAARMDNGMGPLRIWPGGLCLSRAVGDFDVGDSVLPFPHVMQVLVPPTGARLLVASDGVWDAYEKMTRIGSMLRSWPLDVCPARLIQSIVRAYGGLRDDTSLVVADILPPGKTFPEAVQAAQARAKLSGVSMGLPSPSAGGAPSPAAAGGGGCGCFGGGAPPPPPPPPPKPSAAPRATPSALSAHPLKLEVLADVDVAAVMGLMPDAEPDLPGWYDEYVGEQLFALAAEAMACWREANERRTGRRPATPQLEATVRAARISRASASSEGLESEPAWGGGMRRNASVFFPQAVADEGAEYSDRFGHYHGFKPESLGSDSPGGSLHSAGREGSTRAGGYRYADASVRAGSRYQAQQGPDYSVRAGGRYVPEAEGDAPMLRDGSVHFASAMGSFRSDPSIRTGSDALRLLSDSASEAGAGPLAEAAAESGRRHGAGGGAFAPGGGEAPPKNGRAAPGSGLSALSSAQTSAPIPVPRSVTFGGVSTMGAPPPPPPAGGAPAGGAKGGAALEDSPMGFGDGGLQAAGGSGPMDTILEG